MNRLNYPHIRSESDFMLPGFVLLVFMLCQPGSLFATESYTFGIVPQQAASKIVNTWTPVLDYLSKKTGHKLRITTAKNIPVFESRLKTGQYDFAYMNPYHYVTYHKKPGYEAFAKAKNKKIHGIIVVHKDSPYKKLADLANNKLAFPSPLAFAASILTRGQLSNTGVEFTPVYVSSHDSVYRNVANRNFIAGGGVIRTFKAASKNTRDQLRILYKTPGYTPHSFSAHPRVPAKVVQDIQSAMQEMDHNKEGIILLNRLKIKGLSPASNDDWNDVRRIGM